LLRLLIAHQIIGSVIGKKGAKIKELQELSGSKITISKEMLPGSTERQVDILGAPDSIQIAIRQIGEAVSGDTPSVSTIPYVPHNRTIFDTSSLLAALPTEDNVETKTLSIPSDMVGCIIGKGGVLINHIRRLSGSRISIEKLPDADNQRLFTLTGTLTSNEKALNLLYAQLESEKKKRLNAASKKATDFASQIEKETEVAEN
jgi:heterogeneous nuclear rnp K-like protein 2